MRNAKTPANNAGVFVFCFDTAVRKIFHTTIFRHWFDRGGIVGYTSIMASEQRFSVVKKMMEAKGYRMVRVTGSHHVFAKAGARTFPVPVHNGKVEPSIVRSIQKLED